MVGKKGLKSLPLYIACVSYAMIVFIILRGTISANEEIVVMIIIFILNLYYV